MPLYLIALERHDRGDDLPAPGYAQRLAALDDVDLDAFEIYLEDGTEADETAIEEAIDEALSELDVRGVTHADFSYDPASISQA